MAPPPSPFAWPVMLGAASYAFPALAAARARRSLLRDPAGQVAGTWLVVGALNTLGLGQVLGAVPRGVRVGTILVVVTPLLLVEPLLTWLGVDARRRRLAQLGVLAAAALGLAAIADDRAFRLVAGPVMALAMAVLAAAALARTVRHDLGGPASPERASILGALVTHFVTSMLARPLIETLFATDPRAMLDAHMGAQLVYAGCMTVIAWGVSRRPTPTPAAAAPAPPAAAGPPRAYPLTDDDRRPRAAAR